MKDIANETGFSITTVSIALSGKESRLAPETKKIILDTAQARGYKRNYLASGLITKKTQVLGVIMPDISNSFFARITKGISFEAEKNEYDIMLIDTGNNPAKDVLAAKTLLERSVDGILYVFSPSEKKDHAVKCIEMCQEEGVPIVLMDRTTRCYQSNVIMLNHVQGGYLAAKHLLDLGHTRIGCVANTISADPARKRFSGFKMALREAGIPLDTSLFMEGGYRGNYENADADAGYKCTKSLLALGVTAIFAFNDITAFGVYSCAKDLGLQVPDDFSLIGFDDIYFSEIMEVPLTTIRQPSGSIGIAAVQKMMRLISGEDDEKASIFEPKLIVRKSTRQL